MSPPNLLPAALQELVEAIRWYETQTPGLGIEFLNAVNATLRAIGEAPESHAPWSQNHRFRRKVVHRFPYVVFFHVRDSGLEVVAIAHARRRPGYWLLRTGP